MLRLELSDETQVLLSIEKESVHPRNNLLNILDIMALFLIRLLKEQHHLTKLEKKALAHIRQATKNFKKS